MIKLRAPAVQTGKAIDIRQGEDSVIYPHRQGSCIRRPKTENHTPQQSKTESMHFHA